MYTALKSAACQYLATYSTDSMEIYDIHGIAFMNPLVTAVTGKDILTHIKYSPKCMSRHIGLSNSTLAHYS